MRTPPDNPHTLKLGELMRITRDLRRSGFSTGRASGRLTALQLRVAVASFLRFRQLSRMAFLVYSMLLCLAAVTWLSSSGWYTFSLCLICFLGLLGFLIGSSSQRAAFLTALGSRGTEVRGLLLLALPLYFVVSLHWERGMRLELSRVFRELGLSGTHPAE